MEQTLQMNHIFPTCPDTLRSYPFVNEDPFITQEVPHLYFAANQYTYGERVIKQEENKKVKLLSIPIFRRTKSLVLVDTETLETYEYKLSLGDLTEGRTSTEGVSSQEQDEEIDNLLSF